MTTEHKSQIRFRMVMATVSGVAFLLGNTGSAIASNPALLEEVTVTARRTEESLQATPIAVSAFSRLDLQARGIQNVQDVARYVPNVEFFDSGIAGKSSGQVYIRGVGQFDYLLTTDPGVGVYVDGVYLARTMGNILDLVDIERVEILRGPQGTLYGKNTVGGAINVISRRPSDQLEANLDVKVGEFDLFNTRANVSGPLVKDSLNGKLAISTNNADGYADRPLANDQSGNQDNYATQGMLDWAITDQLGMLLAVDYTNTDEEFTFHHVEQINISPLVQLYNALAGPLAPLHGLSLPTYDERWLTNQSWVDLSTDSNYNKQEIWGASGTIDWDISGSSLKSITGYRNADIKFGTDPDGSPVVVIDEKDANDQEQFSQEVQLTGLSFGDKLTWVTGLYYLWEDAKSTMDIRTYEGIYQALELLPAAILPLGPVSCPAPLPAPCAGGAGNPVNIGLDIGRFANLHQEASSMSAYGQVSYALTDPLKFTLGLRYTYEEKDFSYSSMRLQSGVYQVTPTSRDDSWTDLSPRFGVDYQWTDDILAYISIAKGYKSGGFNGRGSTINEIQPYDPEEIWVYETGLKTEWFDHRLRLNGAMFYNDYTDLQFLLSSSDSDGTQVIVVDNAGEAESKGFELELMALPVEALQISASVGYLDAEYTQIDPGAGITTDQVPIATPEWTAAGGVEYSLPIAELGSFSLRADYTYSSKTYFDAVNTESISQEAYGLLNLRAAFSGPDDTWSLAVGVTNVTDKEYRVMGAGVLESLGFATAVYGRPQEWYVQARYRY